MEITIHRGASQIGGCITEISTDGCKIFIDLGSNLPGTAGQEFTREQVERLTAGADAVFYTHYHGDHVGLCRFVPEEIKQYIGRGAKEVMMCQCKALKNHEYEAVVGRMEVYEPLQSVYVGGKGLITVTPLFVDHSAFDAYMFKICCEGKTVLHTGDFRRHGFLGKALMLTLRKYAGSVDVLIIEGTMLGRKQERVISENDIERNVISLLKAHKYVFALCSSADKDRLASFHAACKVTGRLFVVDEYQKSVLDVFSHYAGSMSSLFDFNKVFRLVNFRALNVRRLLGSKGFLMPVRMTGGRLINAMTSVYHDEPAWLIYSMWSGYADEGKPYAVKEVVELRRLFGHRIADGVVDGFHTSGHADVGTLMDVCRTVSPKVGIVPIHRDESSCIDDLSFSGRYRVFSSGENSFDGIKIRINENIAPV